MSPFEQQPHLVNIFKESIAEGSNIIYSRRVSDDLAETIPNIESLIMTGNNLQELGDIDPLGKLPKLSVLSLLTNPVASKKLYREYVIFK